MSLHGKAAGMRGAAPSRWQRIAIVARCSAASVLLTAPTLVSANNVGENAGWQFHTTADKVNRAAVEDMRQKKQSGYYAAPVYNTFIDRQYNCNVSSLAAGSQGTSTAVGNSPTSSGHSTSALGNSDTATLNTGDSAGTINGTQKNSGAVRAGSSGEVETIVDGNTYQTLNNTQDNSGSQTATVSASNACQFGPLN